MNYESTNLKRKERKVKISNYFVKVNNKYNLSQKVIVDRYLLKHMQN